jgi:hypothetical protein
MLRSRPYLPPTASIELPAARRRQQSGPRHARTTMNEQDRADVAPLAAVVLPCRDSRCLTAAWMDVSGPTLMCMRWQKSIDSEENDDSSEPSTSTARRPSSLGTQRATKYLTTYHHRAPRLLCTICSVRSTSCSLSRRRLPPLSLP